MKKYAIMVYELPDSKADVKLTDCPLVNFVVVECKTVPEFKFDSTKDGQLYEKELDDARMDS